MPAAPSRRPRSAAETIALALALTTALALALVVPAPAAGASLDARAGGALSATGKDGRALVFPLAHTDVAATVAGPVAGVTVTQVFENPHAEVLEAIYVFPLPESAAVDDMELRIGARVVKAVLRTREDAREEYERARAQGKAAALLDEERPNLFTTSVANVAPGARVEVRLHYVEALRYEHGAYSFDFPMTVGPRYVPGEPLPLRSGEGIAEDTTRVPDASRITPPPDLDARSGADIALSLAIDAGVPLEDVGSPSHDVVVERPSATQALVRLAPHDAVPNKTFTCRFRTAGRAIRTGLLAHKPDAAEPGHFLLVLQPQAEPDPSADVTPKEMIFVLDTSGSMYGRPIEAAKATMRHALRNMNPDDTFLVLGFDHAASALADRPLPNTPANVAEGIAFVDAFQGEGGTNMNAGIDAALGLPRDPRRMRIVFFMTDGFIGNEREILAQIARQLGETRIFPFGVGSDVNRHLVAGMAELGRGEPEYVRLSDDPETIAAGFYERIRRPVLTDVSVDFEGLEVAERLPARVPDLFEARPLVIAGRYARGGKGRVVVRGRVRGKQRVFATEVELPERADESPEVARLWARRRIHGLEQEALAGDTPELVRAITGTAFAFGLVSRFTSFVAIEHEVRVDPADPGRTVMVPVPLPEGVSPERIFGSLSRREIPPGDPILAVRAPASARRVTAYFPFGLSLRLGFDRVTGTWRGRFLVPKGVADGLYHVRVVVEDARGKLSARDVFYRLDSTGPELLVTLGAGELRAGTALALEVDTVEPAKEVTLYAEPFGEEQLPLAPRPGDPLRFEGDFVVPLGTAPGTYEAVIVARDAAGNRTEQRLTFTVVE